MAKLPKIVFAKLRAAGTGVSVTLQAEPPLPDVKRAEPAAFVARDSFVKTQRFPAVGIGWQFGLHAETSMRNIGAVSARQVTRDFVRAFDEPSTFRRSHGRRDQ